MSRAQPGGYEFNYELSRIRTAVKLINDYILEIFKHPGPSTIIALAGQIAAQLPIILDASQNIEKIGKQAKRERTDQ
jgi:hypothetical protein